jgi:OmcA/MtrC family decaheme c-type cytochrome
MIHGIHGNSKRTYPFTHGNKVQGVFGMAGALTAAGSFFADQKVTIGGVSTTVVAAGTAVAVGETFQSIADLTTAAARTAGYTGNAVSAAENYAAEVAWPGVGINCNACHVNNSYKQDLGPLGTVAQKPFLAGSTTTLETDPTKWLVISPKAASCTACHDSSTAMGHVTSFGGSAFGGTLTQSGYLAAARESCDDCHAPGAVKGVDFVHGQK